MTKIKKFNGLPTEVVSPNPERIIHTITIEVICTPEDIPVEGNCLASGNDQVDRQQEKWIQHQLDNGNPWAWCRVEVRATMGEHTASEYLGGCSYLSGADFMKPGGYYDDMLNMAVADMLALRVEAAETESNI